MPKICFILRNASNKSCCIKWGTKKSMGAYVYPQEWSKGARKIDMLKYYNVQKRKMTFTLGQLTIFNRLLLPLSITVKEGPHRL